MSVGRLGAGSLKPTQVLAAADRCRDRAACLCRAPPHRLGAAIDRRRHRRAPFDRACGAAPPRPLPRRCGAQGGVLSLRVALPRRPAAHGRQALSALRAPGARGHRRSHQDRRREAQRARPRLLPRRRRRPQPPGLRRAARRRARHDGHRVRRARQGRTPSAPSRKFSPGTASVRRRSGGAVRGRRAVGRGGRRCGR
ncbi:MAG: hypothetical protein JWO74_1599 [Solirubrobacterales bacterium]|nr:hypothetical protein [Solirubrobacterales bacterium]